MIGKSCTTNEIEMFSNMPKQEWKLNNEDIERGLDYQTWIKTAKTVLTMKAEGLSFINIDEFFRIYDLT